MIAKSGDHSSIEMAANGFTAVNVESDNESEHDVDDTEELQIEEGLRLYQDALRLHSDPATIDLVVQRAYEELFDSEIFQYPESHNLLRRIELFGHLAEPEELLLEDEDDVVDERPIVGDNAPNTLPQIVHLAHKNFGQFLLRLLKRRFVKGEYRDRTGRTHRRPLGDTTYRFLENLQLAKRVLSHFVDALDKDEVDYDLWQSAASIAHAIGSPRVARFCLEAILDGDEDDDVLLSLVKLPALAQTMAGHNLRLLAKDIDDALSTHQSPLSQMTNKKLSVPCKQRLAAQQVEVTETATLINSTRIRAFDPMLDRHNLQAPGTWLDLVETIYRFNQHDVDGRSGTQRGRSIEFDSLKMADRAKSLLHNRALAVPDLNQPRFIDLDSGCPTVVNPQAAMSDLATHSSTLKIKVERPPLSRKRSLDLADSDDDESSRARIKTRRIRQRDSILETDEPIRNNESKAKSQAENDLEDFAATDAWAFDTIDNILGVLEVSSFGINQDFRQLVQSTDEPAATIQTVPIACSDMYNLMSSFDVSVARRAENRVDLDGVGVDVATHRSRPREAHPLKCNTFSDSPGDSSLLEYIASINKRQLCWSDVAMDTIDMLLRPSASRPQQFGVATEVCSSYLSHAWTDDFRALFCDLLSLMDPSIYANACKAIDTIRGIAATHVGTQHLVHIQDHAQYIQAIFELHLERYADICITHNAASSEGAQEVRHSVDRWSELAGVMAQIRSAERGPHDQLDQLTLRYLFASVFQLELSSEVQREHVIGCYRELRELFVTSDSPDIELPNTGFMSALSIATIDHAISQVTTAEFFRTVFAKQEGDPVTIVEQLESVLGILHANVPRRLGIVQTLDDGPEGMCDDDGRPDQRRAPRDMPGHKMHEIANLLQTDDNVNLQFALWERLVKAYQSMNHQPMVVNTYLRWLECIVAELYDPVQNLSDVPARYILLLTNMTRAQRILDHVFRLVTEQPDALAGVDSTRIQYSLTAIVYILRIAYATDLHEDEVRLEVREKPPQAGKRRHQDVLKMIHSLQLHAWLVMYVLVKDAMSQRSNPFSQPEDDRLRLLRVIHRLVGMRNYCCAAKRILPQFIKKELTDLRHVDGHDLEFAQVLYDLYNIRCFLDPSNELLAHGAVYHAQLDRSSALQAADLLLKITADIKINDLHKHALRDAIETVHATVSRKKPCLAILLNREICSQSLDAPIEPSELYGCLSGRGQVSTIPVSAAQAPAAVKGWFFLVGKLSLSKHYAQKRSAPGPPSEDLESAAAFFRQDIETGVDKWESWFRLAQVMDAKLEECLLWSADKLNSSARLDIAKLERTGMHCYIMAVAQATRLDDVDFASSTHVAALYGCFAQRLYASTRPPFSMQAFQNHQAYAFSSGKFEKLSTTQPLDERAAWKVTRTLLKRAIAGAPGKWALHLLLGKCLWKMYRAKVHGARETTYQDVLAAFKNAIELLPKERKDSKKEPVLEPHYKLISTVHKLVTSHPYLAVEEACDILDFTIYAKQVPKVSTRAEWPAYILEVLRKIRQADKSNWYHRFIIRCARILYEQDKSVASAILARHELMQQMFTKTMTLQVWKPEHERVGRHFVYTTTYTRFFVSLLDRLEDCANFDLLVRRMRRRASDYVDFQDLWQDLVNVYLRVLRRVGKIPIAHEVTVFSTLSRSDFEKQYPLLEEWCQCLDNESIVRQVLYDCLELKRLNGPLMKATPIDDMVGDTYAYLYSTTGASLWQAHQERQRILEAERLNEQKIAETKSVMSVNALMNNDDPDPPTSPLTVCDLDDLAGLDGAMDGVLPLGLAPTRRKIGIGRREIRMCAEACVAKLSPRSAKAQDITDATKVATKVRLPSRRRDQSDESELSDVDEEVVRDGNGAASSHHMTSSPAPVHDVKASQDVQDDLNGTSDAMGSPSKGGDLGRAELSADMMAEVTPMDLDTEAMLQQIDPQYVEAVPVGVAGQVVGDCINLAQEPDSDAHNEAAAIKSEIEAVQPHDEMDVSVEAPAVAVSVGTSTRAENVKQERTDPTPGVTDAIIIDGD